MEKAELLRILRELLIDLCEMVVIDNRSGVAKSHSKALLIETIKRVKDD